MQIKPEYLADIYQKRFCFYPIFWEVYMKELIAEIRYQKAVSILEQLLEKNLISPIIYDKLLEKYQNRYATLISCKE